MKKYSVAEMKLFTDVGLYWLLDTPIPVANMFGLAVEKAFLDDQKGPHVEALRRGMKAFKAGNPYRMTPEFDALITY